MRRAARSLRTVNLPDAFSRPLRSLLSCTPLFFKKYNQECGLLRRRGNIGRATRKQTENELKKWTDSCCTLLPTMHLLSKRRYMHITILPGVLNEGPNQRRYKRQGTQSTAGCAKVLRGRLHQLPMYRQRRPILPVKAQHQHPR